MIPGNDPEKWEPVFGKDQAQTSRGLRPRQPCSRLAGLICYDGVMGERRLLSKFDGRMQRRLLTGVALILALGVAGCGRKGGLDPPPAAGIAATAQPDDGLAGGPGPQPGDPAVVRAEPQRPASPGSPFFLDWLVN